jgi:thioester reductase-like protein
MNEILITGANGLIGYHLARKYATLGEKLFLLVHEHSDLLEAFCKSSQIEIIQGDITKPRLGLSEKEYTRLASSVTHILHCAAKTDFSLSLAEAKRVNVLGTSQVVDFAKDCKNFKQFGALSTAYVAGKREGVIRETELEHGDGFVNAYERSKYQMEKLLRKEMGILPIVVYRLSTVIGNSRTGKVEQFNAIHQALFLYYHGFIPMVAGKKQVTIDFVSSDYAAEAIFFLFQKKFSPGDTFHIVSGEKNSLTLEELLSYSWQCFEKNSKQWAVRAIEIPAIVSRETFDLLEKSVAKTRNLVFQRIISSLGYFTPQLSYEKIFDTEKTDRALAGSGIHPVPIREYYDRLVRYCIKTRWGKQS